MNRRRRVTTDAVEIVRHRILRDDPARSIGIEQERLNARIARDLYRLRTRAGLSQRQLAERVGTTASAISRLESADYEGHSLRMLVRIADALGRDVEVRLVPWRRPSRAIA